VHLGAITFTEKAAGEMRARVAAALEDLRAGAAGELPGDGAGEARRALGALRGRGVAATEVATRALAALESLDHATVDTIHGFSSALLRAHPLEAGVDPGFAIDAGERADATRRELWEEFVGEELGRSAARPGLWAELLPRVRLNDLRQVGFALADFGVPADLLRPPFRGPEPQTLLAAPARALVAAADELLGRETRVTDGAEQYLRALRDGLLVFVDQGLDAARRGFTGQPDVLARIHGTKNRPRVDRRRGLTEADRGDWNDLLSRATHLARGLLEVDEPLLAQILEAVAPFALRAREAMLRRGFVTFDGLLALARDLLRDHPTVRRAARERFRMLLVDELQDTDPRQYEIVLLLAAPDGADVRDPLAAVPEPGRLFLVGDPKQSIYRFRGADFGAYRVAVDRVLDASGIELTLSANFRSVPGILEPVNRLFGGPAWSPRGVDARHQPEYAPVETARIATGSEPAVEIWSIEVDPSASADGRRDAEGEALAREIARAVREGRVRYRDITILLRALTHVSHYLRPLREHGVPFVVDGGSEFLRRPEVGHLLSALRTLTDPTDETALLAYLRSPAGGVSDLELADFAAAGGKWDWRRPVDAVGFPRIGARFTELRELALSVRGAPLDTMVRRVLEGTRLLALGAAAFEGAQRVVNLRKLAAAAADLARDGTLSPREILEAIHEGRVVELVSDAPLADDSIDAVRITSIHKMKGLENRWIFVPDLSRGENRSDKDTLLARVVRTPEGREALALRVAGVQNPAGVSWRAEHERHEDAEEVRVLYVAATRARERLGLLVGPAKAPPWVRALAAWGFDPESPPADGARLCDGRVLHRRLERPAAGPRDELPSRDAGVDQARRRHDHAIERLRAAARPFVTPSGLAEHAARPTPGAGTSDRPRAEVGRVVGIAVHRLLERLREEPSQEALVLLEALVRQVALAERAEPGPIASEARAILETFFESGLAARLARLDVLGREVPVLAPSGSGPVLRGTIDLLVRERDGSVVIVDYKTDRETDPSELRRLHGPQLRAYAEAVREALDLPALPRAEIWALRAGTTVTLGSDPTSATTFTAS